MSHDFIIVGAGSAGCVLAERLSASGRHRVLLLETGGPDDSLLISMPKGIGRLMGDPRYNLFYPTEAEEGNGGIGETRIRGMTLGGSSSINGMVYNRGQPQDYDALDALGCTGWNRASILPHFKAIEGRVRAGRDVNWGQSVNMKSLPSPSHPRTLQTAASHPTSEGLLPRARHGAAERHDMLPPDQEHFMSDRKTIAAPSGIQGRLALARWENEGGADDDPPQIPHSGADLNALLAQEQTAIMVAEAATDDGLRDEHREIARQVRDQVDLTPFPSREPHDFERLLPAESSRADGDHFTAEFEALRQHVDALEKELGLQFSEGKIGTKHNNYEHRGRLIRQARGRLNDLGKSLPAAESLYLGRIDPI